MTKCRSNKFIIQVLRKIINWTGKLYSRDWLQTELTLFTEENYKLRHFNAWSMDMGDWKERNEISLYRKKSLIAVSIHSQLFQSKTKR